MRDRKKMTNPIRRYRKLRIKQYGRQIKEMNKIFFSLPSEVKKQVLDYMEISLNIKSNCEES